MDNEQKNISFQTYQEFTRTTAIYPKEKALEYTTLGLVSEAGEIAGKVKKIIRDQGGIENLTEENKKNLRAECGDVFWYLARLCDELGTTMEDVCRENEQKLTSRKERNVLGGSGDNR